MKQLKRMAIEFGMYFVAYMVALYLLGIAYTSYTLSLIVVVYIVYEIEEFLVKKYYRY